MSRARGRGVPPVSRRKFLGLLGLAGASFAPARADGSSVTRPVEVVTQRPDTGACGPCALGNALLNGDTGARRAFHQLPGASAQDRVDALISRYGAKPSETYGPRRARFVNGAGITSEDMPFLANDLLAAAGQPSVQGGWLDQRPNENSKEQLRRVHQMCRASLRDGLPLIVEARAFAADSSAFQPTWVNLYAHWMALVGIYPDELPAGASGFYCQFADSVTGRVIPAFAYAEFIRPFMATRGFALRADGGKDWRWLSGHPYILLKLPDLPLAIESRLWHEQAFIALTYGLRRGTV